MKTFVLTTMLCLLGTTVLLPEASAWRAPVARVYLELPPCDEALDFHWQPDTNDLSSLWPWIRFEVAECLP